MQPQAPAGVERFCRELNSGDEVRALSVLHRALEDVDLPWLVARDKAAGSVFQQVVRQNMPILCKAMLDRISAASLPAGVGTQSSLFDAACAGMCAMCEVLLSSPLINPNALDDKGRTALHCAVLNCRLDASRALLDHPRFTAACAKTSKHGFTALHCAAMKGFGDMCRMLVQHRRFLPAVDAVTSSGKTAWDVARGEAKDILQSAPPAGIR